MFEFKEIKKEPPVSFRVKTNPVTHFLTRKKERTFYINDPVLGILNRLTAIDGFYECLQEGSTLSKRQMSRIVAEATLRLSSTGIRFLLCWLWLPITVRVVAAYLYFKLPTDTLHILAKTARIKADAGYDALLYFVYIFSIKRDDTTKIQKAGR